MRITTLLALFTLLTTSAATAQIKLPRYWSVHIDQPRPSDRAAFERLGIEEAETRRGVYAAHALPRPRGWKLSTADGVYFSFRPAESLADLETPSPLPDQARKELSAKTSPISERTHRTLLAHHNEIMETDTDLSSVTGSAAPPHLRLRTERIDPARFHDYDEVMKRVRAALDAHGVRMLALYSAYGDGTYRYLLMADRPIDLRAVAGRPLLAEWRALLTSVREVEAKARYDLSATEPAEWLQR